MMLSAAHTNPTELSFWFVVQTVFKRHVKGGRGGYYYMLDNLKTFKDHSSHSHLQRHTRKDSSMSSIHTVYIHTYRMLKFYQAQ